MKFSTKFTTLTAICIALASLGMHSGAWAKDKFDDIFFFGDSLSDPGNRYQLEGLTARPPYDLIPSAPYSMRGHQFSNGKTWAQKFAKKMHEKKSGKAALKSPGRFGNYAFGGARANPAAPSQVPSGNQQIDLYMADHGRADSEALYVIQFGGNDVRDALTAGDASLVEAAARSTSAMIERLYQSNARHFLLVDVPNLGLTPAVQMQGPAAVFAGQALSMGLNNGLDQGVAYLETIHPDISIKRLSFFTILESVIDAPEGYGIKNTTDTCIRVGVKRRAKCRKPRTYLFWDGIHPTAAVHRIMGKKAAELYQ